MDSQSDKCDIKMCRVSGLYGGVCVCAGEFDKDRINETVWPHCSIRMHHVTLSMLFLIESFIRSEESFFFWVTVGKAMNVPFCSQWRR